MNATPMLLLSAKRVTFHPDFLAELFATWRFGWSSLKDESEVVRRAVEFNNEGFDFAESVTAAQDQIKLKTVCSVTDRIWHEYRAALAVSGKTGGKSDPPDSAVQPPI